MFQPDGQLTLLTEALSVRSILPTTGPVSGQTVVTVTGTSFRDTTELYCRFGTAGRTPATFGTSELLRCLSPTSGGATTVSLEVSNNNQDFTTNSTAFIYQLDETVASVSVTHGPQRM